MHGSEPHYMQCLPVAGNFCNVKRSSRRLSSDMAEGAAARKPTGSADTQVHKPGRGGCQQRCTEIIMCPVSTPNGQLVGA